MELQREIRIKVKEKERQAALEKEKNRIKQGKEITETRRIHKENQEKLHIDLMKKQKNTDELERDKIKRLLREDKRNRFGKDYDKIEENAPIYVKEEFYKVFHQMNKIYRYTDKNRFNGCLKTIGKYVNNILKNPSEPKYHRIKTQNKVYIMRINDTIGGFNLLKAAGFEKEEEFLMFKGTIERLKEFTQYLRIEIDKMENYM